MITVILADDHSIIRDGLRSMLAAVDDIEVVGEAENGRTAVEIVRDLCPDVVVMDIGMKDLNGIEATRRIVEEGLGSRVIALSMHSDRQYVSEMLKAGAAGYLLKDSAFEELVDAIRAVADGRMFIADAVTGVVLDDYIQRLSGVESAPECEPGTRALSPREREVLALTADGKNTKECAACLGLSVKTVETHRRQIMDKLGIYNLAGLIKYALRNGYTSLDR
jgi:DNA-binding NarL/FixJ family response regulator